MPLLVACVSCVGSTVGSRLAYARVACLSRSGASPARLAALLPRYHPKFHHAWGSEQPNVRPPSGQPLGPINQFPNVLPRTFHGSPVHTPHSGHLRPAGARACRCYVRSATGSRRGAEEVPNSRVALKRSFRITVVTDFLKACAVRDRELLRVWPIAG